jgi:hypothetical protein
MPITVSGTQITFNDATTQTTAFTGSTGVTSVATGNGLSGGTITTTGTLTIACPTHNTVGSYVTGDFRANSGNNVVYGTNYAAGTGYGNQVSLANSFNWAPANFNTALTGSISGTWRWMAGGASGASSNQTTVQGLMCRVS